MDSDFSVTLMQLLLFSKCVRDLLLKVAPMFGPLERKPCKSIVRRIGTWLPLKPPPRMFFNMVMSSSSNSSKGSSVLMLGDEAEDHQSFVLWSKLGEGNHVNNISNEKENFEARVSELELEIKKLRFQMADALEMRNCRCLSECSSVTDGGTLSPMPPPAPPPPPPPMPNLLFSPTMPLRSRINTTAVQDKRIPNPHNTPGYATKLSSVLEEMKYGRRKLRPIKRSPGGRPVKPPREPKDAVDCLIDVLKRRYAACHSEQSPESSDADDSFGLSPVKTLKHIHTPPPLCDKIMNSATL